MRHTKRYFIQTIRDGECVIYVVEDRDSGEEIEQFNDKADAFAFLRVMNHNLIASAEHAFEN